MKNIEKLALSEAVKMLEEAQQKLLTATIHKGNCKIDILDINSLGYKLNSLTSDAKRWINGVLEGDK